MLGIGVQAFLVETAFGDADTIAFPRHRREIADDHHEVIRVVPPAHEGKDALGMILVVDPREPLVIEVAPVKGRRTLIKPVEVADQVLHASVERIVKQVPIQAPGVVPLVLLAEFSSHEQQLLSRVAVHEGVVGAQVGKTLPPVAGHASQDRALAVDHLVMGQRQDEVLVEGIE